MNRKDYDKLDAEDGMMKIFLLHAEYCPGWAYQGWWLYADQIVDGKIANHAFESQWLKHGWMLDWAREKAVTAGATNLPPAKEHEHKLAKEFHKIFPFGLILQGEYWVEAALQGISYRKFHYKEAEKE